MDASYRDDRIRCRRFRAPLQTGCFLTSSYHNDTGPIPQVVLGANSDPHQITLVTVLGDPIWGV